jgi:REP element-mobilizing transposase RayT
MIVGLTIMRYFWNDTSITLMDKFKNKYRIEPGRAQWWDYARDAAYFVTINVKNRHQRFGKIVDGEMILSPAGKIADVCWCEIPDHGKNIELGEYIVKPDHVHGILILNGGRNRERGGDRVDSRDKACLVSTINPTITPLTEPIGRSRFQNPGKNTLSSIVGGYKSAVSKFVRRLGFEFEWQSRFHDHVIRDQDEYQRICKYILDNPANLADDKLFHF